MKKKIIILSGLATFLIFGIVVLAAFMFNKSILGDATSGKISLDYQKIVVRNDVFGQNGSITTGDTYIDLTEDGKYLKNVNCYATKKQGYDDEDATAPHLNQIGAEFSFTNTIDVYVRVYFQQAWISHKVYRNNIVLDTAIKHSNDALTTAFNNNPDWRYDSQTGYLYMKTKISPSAEKEDGGYEANAVSFKFGADYFYNAAANPNYREAIIVQFSYMVDIVQANRASALWGFNVPAYLAN